MLWSPQQDDALVQANDWYLNSERQVFHLFGYAGTGKTTLAKHLAEGIDGEVLFAAYTGKATHVLRSKGCQNASTIHSLLYISLDKTRERLVEMEKQLSSLIQELIDAGFENIDNHIRVKDLRKLIEAERQNLKSPNFMLNSESPIKDASLVIIDECSMVDSKMGADLCSFGTKILVLGDPAQLPPIMGGGYFTEKVKPNIMLEEIHRQAEDSPIIRMATETRKGKSLSIGSYGPNCQVLSFDEKIDPDFALSFDQILVGKNATRFATNKRMRQLKGFQDPYPVVGDRLVCLRNNPDQGLYNGSLATVSHVEGVIDQKVIMDVVPEDSTFAQTTVAHEHHFLGKGEELPWYEKKEANEFDYGYALTVHKSQGSQWNKVLLFDESSSFRQDKWRWLYTGITRSAEELTISKR